MVCVLTEHWKAAKENGTNVPHERLTEEVIVQQPGYVYIYLSNDNDQPLEVFFDDFAVTHSHSAIVQADDYYPFGLSFNSYKRESSMGQKHLYNNKELQTDLDLGWYDYGARFYDPACACFHSVDPKADSYYSWSPYNYTGNNPIRRVDINGEGWGDIVDAAKNYAREKVNNLVVATGKAIVQTVKNEVNETRKEISNSIDNGLNKVGTAIGITETSTEKGVMKQTGNVKKINNIAKKAGPLVDAVLVTKDALETDFSNPEETGDFIENTVQTAAGMTPVIGPAIGIITDDSKESDGVTNTENLSKSYSSSFDQRNQLLKRFETIRDEERKDNP